MPVIAVNVPAKIIKNHPFIFKRRNTLCVVMKSINVKMNPNMYWLVIASAEVKPDCIASFTIVDKIP